MELLKFLESIKGRELVAFCVLLVACRYLYVEFSGAQAHGMSFQLSAVVMAILTAGAVVRLSRRIFGSQQGAKLID